MRQLRSNGFTLMELMVVIFILQLVIVPLYVAFSGSKKIMINAREMSKAVSFGSSMLAGLRKLDIKKLSELPMTAEGNLPEFFSPESLGLTKVKEGFQRFLTINLIDKSGQEGGPFFEASVEIRWKYSKTPNAPELKLSIKGLLAEKNQ